MFKNHHKELTVIYSLIQPTSIYQAQIPELGWKNLKFSMSLLALMSSWSIGGEESSLELQ